MPSRYIRSLLLPLVVISSSCSRPAPQPAYDLIIAGGSVLDGDGAPARALDVGVRDGKIAAIGSLGAAEARQRIDASGLVVAPGFIDMHNHSDYTILAEPKVRKHDPAGRDDDGAGRVALGGSDEDGSE